MLQTTKVQVMVLAGPVPLPLESPFANTSKEAFIRLSYFNVGSFFILYIYNMCNYDVLRKNVE